MPAPEERECRGDRKDFSTRVVRTMSMLQTLRAWLRGEGELDQILMIEAPDLWLLRPATSVRGRFIEGLGGNRRERRLCDA